MLRAAEVDLHLACLTPDIVAPWERAGQNTGFLVLRFLDERRSLASGVKCGQSVWQGSETDGTLLSAMEEGRERRQLQFLKNVEVGLGYPDIDGEGASDSFKWNEYGFKLDVDTRQKAYFQALYWCYPQGNLDTRWGTGVHPISRPCIA